MIVTKHDNPPGLAISLKIFVSELDNPFSNVQLKSGLFSHMLVLTLYIYCLGLFCIVLVLYVTPDCIQSVLTDFSCLH